jgi:Putative peptidoglycan-binding domain-containing protein
VKKLVRGSQGAIVLAVQCFLDANAKQATGKYNAATEAAVKAYQKRKGIAQTGTVGSATWPVILKELPTLKVGDKGKYVRTLEALMGIKIDGKYTALESEQVRLFKAVRGLPDNGTVGTPAWKALFEVNDDTVEIPEPSTPKPSPEPAPSTPGTNKRPKDFKQGRPSPWAKKIYSSTGNKSQTMASSGCGPTAAADVLYTLKDKSVTPWVLAQLCMKWGFRTANSGTAWGAFKKLAAHYGCSKFAQTASHATAIAALGNGALNVASMKKGFWTKGGHFICLWKCDGATMFACDPASTTRKKQILSQFKKENKQYFIFFA